MWRFDKKKSISLKTAMCDIICFTLWGDIANKCLQHQMLMICPTNNNKYKNLEASYLPSP